MRVDAIGDLNLLQLDGLLLLLGFLFALLLLEAVLAVVHDLADRRLRLGSNQNQIHILVVSQSERLAGTHDPERLSLCVDDPNLPYINSLIDESLGLLCIRAYGYAPPLACLILFLIFRKEISRHSVCGRRGNDATAMRERRKFPQRFPKKISRSEANSPARHLPTCRGEALHSARPNRTERGILTGHAPRRYGGSQAASLHCRDSIPYIFRFVKGFCKKLRGEIMRVNSRSKFHSGIYFGNSRQKRNRHVLHRTIDISAAV